MSTYYRPTEPIPLAKIKKLKNIKVIFDKKQNLKLLMRLTLINILNAKGVIYTYYKQQQERELNEKSKMDRV